MPRKDITIKQKLIIIGDSVIKSFFKSNFNDLYDLFFLSADEAFIQIESLKPAAIFIHVEFDYEKLIHVDKNRPIIILLSESQNVRKIAGSFSCEWLVTPLKTHIDIKAVKMILEMIPIELKKDKLKKKNK